MPDTDSWIIKAIEKEAMVRARAERDREPTTFRFLGYDPEQVSVIMWHVFGRVELYSTMTPEEIKERLNARYR